MYRYLFSFLPMTLAGKVVVATSAFVLFTVSMFLWGFPALAPYLPDLFGSAG